MAKQFSFEDIDKARQVLGLDNEALIYEIKENYYELSKQYHPDRADKKDKKDYENKFKKITWAYNMLMDYVAAFRVSFKEKDVKKMSLDKNTYKHLKQFYDGWWEQMDF